MKVIVLCLGICALALSGCESLSKQVREKFESRDESRTRTFGAPSRAVYDAMRVAIGQMGYRFVRGGAAQGELEAVNEVSANDSLRGSQQIAMKVHLHPTLDGSGTDVSVRLTEIVEGNSSNRGGFATEAPLRDTPQYEVFFREVQKALNSQSAQPGTQK
jgi:hypothetical protein